jgi:isopenicillin N synthase-like dioxygenase
VSWDTSCPKDAQEADIPALDLTEYFTTGPPKVLDALAVTLRAACEEVGFFSIVGHQTPSSDIQDLFEMVCRLHALSEGVKRDLMMDRPDWPVGGIGYRPVNSRKLPARPTANLNETFIVKRDHELSFDGNRWPGPSVLPEFREKVETYTLAMERLGKRLLLVFAAALGMPISFFDEAFIEPLYRLRMTHYPPIADPSPDEFGISPPIDTTFCTIPAQDSPGLTVFDERRRGQIKVPLLKDAFVVNPGEFLRQWPNDRFISVKYFANNNAGTTYPYSVPFFFNANTNFKMTYVPSC